jgi:hypothetical protein
LKQRDLRNLNLGDLKKGPKGAYVPSHTKKRVSQIHSRIINAGLELQESSTLSYVKKIMGDVRLCEA